MIYLPYVRQQPMVYLLSNATHYSTSWGSLHVVGEIQNDLTVPLNSVRIGVDLLDGDGDFLASKTAYTYLGNLPPGQKTCFDITFLNPPSGWSTYRFDDPSYFPAMEAAPALTLISSDGAHDRKTGEYHLSGRVRNDDGQQVLCVRPVGTLYAEDGKVLACGVEYVEALHLYSGQISPFAMTFDGPNLETIENYHLQVDGHSR